MSNILPQQDSQALNQLLRRLNVKTTEPITSGGSPARVLRVTTRDGQDMVVKFHSKYDGLVDGHDMDTFQKKIVQIQKIHHELPGLSPYYVDILHEYRCLEWSAYCMPYYQGQAVTTPLQGMPYQLNTFFVNLRAIITVMIEYGYKTSTVSAPADHFQKNHILRVKRRLWLLKKHLPRDVMETGHIIINGRKCLSIIKIMDLLWKDTNRLARLNPKKLFFPVHGDANLGNFLILNDKHVQQLQAPSFKILDPRGTTAHWDILYDFAKMLFSLSLFDTSMNNGFVITRLSRKGDTCYHVVPRDRLTPGYYEAAINFIDFLNSMPACREMFHQSDPHWQYRLFFLHAMHVVCESACRLSDRKPRRIDNNDRDEACKELSLGLYLVGTLWLNDVLEYKHSTVPDIRSQLDAITP